MVGQIWHGRLARADAWISTIFPKNVKGDAVDADAYIKVARALWSSSIRQQRVFLAPYSFSSCRKCSSLIIALAACPVIKIGQFSTRVDESFLCSAIQFPPLVHHRQSYFGKQVLEDIIRCFAAHPARRLVVRAGHRSIAQEFPVIQSPFVVLLEVAAGYS